MKLKSKTFSAPFSFADLSGPFHHYVYSLAFALSHGNAPLAKISCSEKQTTTNIFAAEKIITLIAEMARVAQVEHANFVSEYHWHILRSKNNICSCPLHMHPSHTYEAQCNTRTTISINAINPLAKTTI